MDDVIIAAVIGAIAVIVAAIIRVAPRRPKKRSPEVSPLQLFLLGTNIAKIGWGKISNTPEIRNIQVLTVTMMNELEFPEEIKDEFKSFLEAKESIKESISESIKELTKTLPRIKELFGIYLISKYGKKDAGFYYIGFDLVNICPMFEIASLQVSQVGPIVVDQLKGIIKEANALDLPTTKLNKILKQIEGGISNNSGKTFDDGRQELIRVGEEYIEILTK